MYTMKKIEYYGTQLIILFTTHRIRENYFDILRFQNDALFVLHDYQFRAHVFQLIHKY